MIKQPKNESGISHIILPILVTLAVVGVAAWQVMIRSSKEEPKKEATPTVQQQKTPVTTQVTEVKQKDPDSPSTLDSPIKIMTSDSKQYFYYGAPAGQNNASPKKILITLHGTGSTAERDYEIWKPVLAENYALASLNWWDGSGDETTDYATPEVMNGYIHTFLESQGYESSDLIVFEGFSRGSANSYSIVAHDRASKSPMIDVAISSSGGAQPPYYDMTTTTITNTAKKPTVYKGVYWILACGDKDPNPTRDGCEAMETSKKFVSAKGATVLGILSDPNAGHGALNISKLNLTKQAFDLIDTVF